MLLWHTLSTYFRARLGGRVQKIPLDAGSRCPNRDGTLSRAGCIFCNEQGSGSGLGGQGVDIPSQWRLWQEKYARTEDSRRFIAYLQSFSNTYGPPGRLRRLLSEVARLPGNLGVSVGTRPDCLDEEKLDILAACPLSEVWLELGLQSAHDATLERINRHHSRTDAERAIRAADARGLKVCGHLMAGLPGEDADAFLRSVRWAAALPLAGIKLHSVYVCAGTELARQYASGTYAPPTKEAYVEMLASALPLLPARMVVHRLTGDPAPGELLAPDWTLDKRGVLATLHRSMHRRGLWQGCRADARQGRPLWFGR